MRVPLTPLDFYRRCRSLFPEKRAVVDEGRRLGFGEFGERVERLAGALRAAGLRPGEIVSVLAPNCGPLLECFYGVPAAGGVVHPVNPRLPALELADLLNDAGARILAFHASATPALREILGRLKAVEQLVIVEGEPGGLDFPALEYEALLRAAQPFAPELAGLDEDRPLALFHTSGGASRPRGVLLSHRTLALHALYAAVATGLREDDVSLCSVPFSHMNGGGNPQLNLAVGASSVLARRNDPETLGRLIAEERVTVWITAPPVLARLLRDPSADRLRRSQLRLVLVGGSPVPGDLLEEAQARLAARCLEVYGLTEASPFVAQAGAPILGVEVRVVDESDLPLPADGEALGEIVVRGNGVMTAYHRDPDATRAALRGGWLHTGDLGSLAPDGRLKIRGRQKDVILVNGRRVPAGPIEAALASHPDVQECGVIAAPDPDRGEVPVGLVVLSPGARATEAALLAHARERLAPFQRPARIELLGSLPKTEGGGVLKSELRTLYART
jgi:fatty-acyl-CoA synthase